MQVQQESLQPIAPGDASPPISSASSSSLVVPSPTIGGHGRERKRDASNNSNSQWQQEELRVEAELEQCLQKLPSQEKDKRGRTLLMRAAFLGRSDIVEKLTAGGAKITADKDKFGYTVFHLAVRGGDLSTVQSCWTGDKALLSPIIGGTTPIWTAIKYGHDDVAAFLLSLDIDFNAKAQGPRRDELLGDHALSSWYLALIELEQGIKAKQSSAGKNIDLQELIIRVAKQHAIFVSMQSLADQAGKKIKFNGALTYDICLEREQALTKKTKEIGVLDHQKVSYRDIVRIISIRDLDALKSLAFNPSLLELTDPKTGYTLLMQAVLAKNGPAVIWLLQQGASVNQQNNLGHTALMIAAWNGSEEIAAHLLRNGAWLRATDNLHRNALDWAHTDSMVQILHKFSEEQLEKLGADIDLSSVMMASESASAPKEEKYPIPPVFLGDSASSLVAESSAVSLSASNSQSSLEQKLVQQSSEVQQAFSILREHLPEIIRHDFPGLAAIVSRRSSIVQTLDEAKAGRNPKKEEELRNIKQSPKLNQFYMHLQQRLNEKLQAAFAVSSGSVNASSGALGTGASIAGAALSFLPGAGIAAKSMQTSAQVKNQGRLRKLARYFVNLQKGNEIFEEVSRQVTIVYQDVILGTKKLHEVGGWEGNTRNFWAAVKQNVKIVQQAVGYQEVLTDVQAMAMQVAARIIDGMQDGQFGLDDFRSKHEVFDGQDSSRREWLITALLKIAMNYSSYELPTRESKAEVASPQVALLAADEIREFKQQPQARPDMVSNAGIGESSIPSLSTSISSKSVPQALRRLSFLTGPRQNGSSIIDPSVPPTPPSESKGSLTAKEELDNLKQQVANLERQLAGLSAGKQQSPNDSEICCSVM